MKKIILALSAIALVVSCSQSRKWTDKERDEVRKVVRDRHDRSAIRHMEAKNYTNLEECVVTTIEETYPDYNRFVTTAANLLRNKGYEVPEDNGKAYAMMAKFPCTVEDVKRKKDLTF